MLLNVNLLALINTPATAKDKTSLESTSRVMCGKDKLHNVCPPLFVIVRLMSFCCEICRP